MCESVGTCVHVHVHVVESSASYHVCVRLCSGLPLPTRETRFILKNLICELCVARISFCQQAVENTSKGLMRSFVTQTAAMWDLDKQSGTAPKDEPNLFTRAPVGECKHFRCTRHSRGRCTSLNQNIEIPLYIL